MAVDIRNVIGAGVLRIAEAAWSVIEGTGKVALGIAGVGLGVACLPLAPVFAGVEAAKGRPYFDSLKENFRNIASLIKESSYFALSGAAEALLPKAAYAEVNKIIANSANSSKTAPENSQDKPVVRQNPLFVDHESEDNQSGRGSIFGNSAEPLSKKDRAKSNSSGAAMG